MQKIISQLSDKNPTPEVYNDTEMKVNSFIEYVQKTNDAISQNTIMWPSYNPKNFTSFFPTDKTKLFDILIWYSKIKSIFNSMINEEKDLLSSIMDLGEFSEMKDLCQYLLRRIMNKNLLPNDYDLMNSTLNANFICKFINAQIDLCILNNLDEYLDRHSSREAIKEQEIIWAHKIANQFPMNFKIFIPRFKNSDLISLFVFKMKNSFNPGPLFKGIQDQRLPQMLSELGIEKNVTSMTDCALEITKAAFRIYIDKTGDPQSEKEELIKSIHSKSSLPVETRQIFHLIDNVMKISNELDKANETEFTYDDVRFLNEDWLKDNNFINMYPSFVYWLIKNPKCTQQIQYIFKDFVKDNKSLPLWIHILRLMSSKNCLEFETNSETETGKIICDISRNTLLRFINDNQDIGIKWINLFISSVPSEIYDQNYCFIYQCQKEQYKVSKDYVNNAKKNSIKVFVQNLFELLLKPNQNENILSEISNDTELISFIQDPAKYIKNRMSRSIMLDFESFALDQNTENYMMYCEKVNKELPQIIEQLSGLIEAEINKKAEITQNQRILEYIEKETIHINDTIDRYNQLLQDLSNNQDFDNVQYIIQCLIEVEDQIRDSYPGLLSSAIAKSVFHLKLSSKADLMFEIEVSEKRIKKNQKGQHKKKFNHKLYFLSSLYTKEDIHNLVFRTQPIKKYIKEIVFHKIEDIDIKNYLSDRAESINRVNIFVLLGEKTKMEYIDLLNKLNETINQMKLMMEQFRENKINSTIFVMPQRISDCIKEIKRNSCAKFSDNKAAININNFIQEKVITVLDQLNYYNEQIKSNFESNSEIYSKWKTMTYKDYQLFDNNYLLVVPKLNEKISKPSFSNLMHIEPLSSPIISVSPNNDITCCYEKLHCSIGPLIPSLYVRPMTINIMNFIDKSVNCEIKVKMHECFSIKNEFKPNELIQIFVSIPDICVDNAVEIRIDGNLYISNDSYGVLAIPIDFHFKLVPLNEIYLVKNIS